jgi:hypothetical protein
MRGERFHHPGHPIPDLAIFIMRTDTGTHTGILHRDHGVLFTLDLCWHRMLRASRCRNVEACVVPDLDPDEVNDATAMCRLIHARHNDPDPQRRYNIPYSFLSGHNNRFNNATGELMLTDGLGLTCSTFVLAVFESVYLPLIDFATWEPRAEDDARHAQLLADMETGFPQHGIPPAEPEHIAAVAAELPCIRVRPEEVAAAGMSDARMVAFRQAERGGRWILELLTPDWAHASI